MTALSEPIPFLQTASAYGPDLPAIIVATGDPAARRCMEFFTVNIRNPHTRRAYFKAVESFAAWCAERDLQTSPG